MASRWWSWSGSRSARARGVEAFNSPGPSPGGVPFRIIGVMSFILATVMILPDPFTTGPMRALPILLLFGAMFYWLWKVRGRRTLLSE